MPTTSQTQPNPPTKNDPQLDIHRDALSNLLEDHAKQSKEVIRNQWRMAMITIGLAFVSLVGMAYFAFAHMERRPQALVEQMVNAQRQVREAMEKSALPPPPATATVGGPVAPTTNAAADAAVLKLVKAQEEALSNLTKIEAQPSASSQSMVQLIGSAAVLALLGLLGLQRLQNFDSEINNVRNSVDTRVDARAKELSESIHQFRQEFGVFQKRIADEIYTQTSATKADLEKTVMQAVSSKVEEQKAKLEAMVNQAVSLRVHEHRDHFEESLKTGQKSVTDLIMVNQEAITRQSAEIHAERNRIEAIQKNINALIEKHSWLKQRDADEKLTSLENITSAGDAHTQAVAFVRTQDFRAAKAALRTIIEKKLLGSYHDFHNAHSEAMRLDDPLLGIGIAEAGLTLYPNQGDLVGDKIHALSSMGKIEEARQFFDDWRAKYPQEFRRSWRVVMFFGNLLDASTLDEKAQVEARQLLKEATDAMPREIKVWSARAEFEANANRYEEAVAIAEEGLKHNPFSQQLRVIFGGYLMVLGRASEAKECYLKALRTDHQNQFQHDVAQSAIPGKLAQAYEACGEPENAVALYSHVLQTSEPRSSIDFTIRGYAQNRLRALALLNVPGAADALKGESNLSTGNFMQMLQKMAEQRAQGGTPSAADEDGND